MKREQAIEWLTANRHLLTSSIKFTPQQIREFFDAYNAITGEKKAVVGCGRCILNMKHRLLSEMNKVSALERYPVYLTTKGTPSLRPNGEPVAYIHAASLESAKVQLEELKKESKNV